MTEQSFGYEHLLGTDEIVLWKHIGAGAVVVQTSKTSEIILRIIMGVMYLALFVMFVKGVLNGDIDLRYSSALYIFGFATILLLNKVISKNRAKRRVMPAYQNAVITNLRLIMYNNANADIFDAPIATISKLKADYDNGSPAICVELSGQVADSVTVFGNFNAGQTIRAIREQLRAA